MGWRAEDIPVPVFAAGDVITVMNDKQIVDGWWRECVVDWVIFWEALLAWSLVWVVFFGLVLTGCSETVFWDALGDCLCGVLVGGCPEQFARVAVLRFSDAPWD